MIASGERRCHVSMDIYYRSRVVVGRRQFAPSTSRTSELRASCVGLSHKGRNLLGRDAKAERQALFDKFEEHKNWRNNIRFRLVNWTTFGVGATLCLVGALLWLGKDETPTWDRLWDLVGPFVIAVVGIYYVYQLMKRLDKAESEVRWLSLMLDQVKDNGQVNYSELEGRLEKLEGRSNTKQGTQRPTQSTSVRAVAEPQ